MEPLRLAYYASSLAAAGARVDGSWTADEIINAWCAAPRPAISYAEWVQRMNEQQGGNSPEKPDDWDEREIRKWNSQFDATEPAEEEPEALPENHFDDVNLADLKALDPVCLKSKPDIKAVFDTWADAKHETAYIYIHIDNTLRHELVRTSDIETRG